MKQSILLFLTLVSLSCNKSENYKNGLQLFNDKYFKLASDELRRVTPENKYYSQAQILLAKSDSMVKELAPIESKAPFPKYSTIKEMFEANGDYKDNCFEILSKRDEDLHIRVSSETLTVEPDEHAKEEVKRDIVYVTFSIFAETDFDRITVTSIPIRIKGLSPKDFREGKLQEKFKQTIYITRQKALEVLNKYNTSSFQDLYHLEQTVYLPSDKFENLYYKEVENVFFDLQMISIQLQNQK